MLYCINNYAHRHWSLHRKHDLNEMPDVGITRHPRTGQRYQMSECRDNRVESRLGNFFIVWDALSKTSYQWVRKDSTVTPGSSGNDVHS